MLRGYKIQHSRVHYLETLLGPSDYLEQPIQYINVILGDKQKRGVEHYVSETGNEIIKIWHSQIREISRLEFPM